jgi:hypothetical protein
VPLEIGTAAAVEPEQNPPESAVSDCNKEVDEVLRYVGTSSLSRLSRSLQGAEARRDPHLLNVWPTTFPEAVFNTGAHFFRDPEAGRVVSLLHVLATSLAGCASVFVNVPSPTCCR